MNHFGSFAQSPNYLLTMNNENTDDYVEVLWIMLSEPNGTALGKQWLDYERFFWDLTKATKCHIHYRTGVEGIRNAHGHFIVSVPRREVSKFTTRLKKFKAWSSWRFKTLSVEEWEPGHGTYWYTEVKHTPLGERVLCPRIYGSCRRGSCEHTAH